MTADVNMLYYRASCLIFVKHKPSTGSTQTGGIRYLYSHRDMRTGEALCF